MDVITQNPFCDTGPAIRANNKGARKTVLVDNGSEDIRHSNEGKAHTVEIATPTASPCPLPAPIYHAANPTKNL